VITRRILRRFFDDIAEENENGEGKRRRRRRESDRTHI
jgi:hypothetical protein